MIIVFFVRLIVSIVWIIQHVLIARMDYICSMGFVLVSVQFYTMLIFP